MHEVDILDNPNELYSAAIEYLSSARNTREEAEKEAAALVDFISRAKSGEAAIRHEQEMVEHKREEDYRAQQARADEQHRRERLWGNIGWATLWVSILALIVGLAISWWRLEANDHAGVDQKHVGEAAAYLVTGWFGQNEEDKLTGMTMISKKRGNYLGQEAWVITYKVKGEPNLVMYMVDNGEMGYFGKGAAKALDEPTDR